MPVDVLALPASSISTKWKEPYASASINQKLAGVVAPGIYRGLRMIPDPLLGDRTVVVQADADHGDHVAVYENANGYSTTYRDITSGDITLSLTAYSNLTVIVTLFIDYAPGSSTTGTFRAYTQSEFNILTAPVRDALVILGTVVVPISGAISSAGILLLNRTIASENTAVGAIPVAQLIRNPGFDLGETNATYAKSSTFWDKSVTVGSGTWKTSTAVVDTGLKSIELNVTSLPISGDILQSIGVPVLEGDLFKASVRIKQLKTISSGSLVFFLEWADANDAVLSTSTLSLDGGVVDLAFRSVETIFSAPAGAVSIRASGVRATTLSPSSTGVFGYIDGVDLLAFPRDVASSYPFDQAARRNLISRSIVVEDPAGTFSSLAANLRFDSSAPSSEGSLKIERRDQSASSLPPALSLLGRIVSLGSQLLATGADARKARLSAPYTTTIATPTLISESLPQTGSSSGVRVYSSSTGGILVTVNAYFDGTNWNKDVSGTNAALYEIFPGYVEQYGRVADAAWSTWTKISTMSVPTVPATSASNSPVIALYDSDGSRRTVFDHMGQPMGGTFSYLFHWLNTTALEYDGFSGTSDVSQSISNGWETSTKMRGAAKHLQVTTNGGKAYFRATYLALNQPSGSGIPANCVYSMEFYVDGRDITGSTGATLHVGWSQAVSPPDVTQEHIALIKTSASSNWFFGSHCNSPSGTTSVDTGVAVSASAIQHFRIEVQGSNIQGGPYRAILWIDGTCRAIITTNLPQNGGTRLAIGLQGTAALTTDIYVSAIKFCFTGVDDTRNDVAV